MSNSQTDRRAWRHNTNTQHRRRLCQSIST